MRRFDDLGIRAISHVGQGDAASEILRIAESEKYNLIVLTSHCRTGFRRDCLGSVAAKVARQPNCRVLMVSGQAAAS